MKIRTFLGSNEWKVETRVLLMGDRAFGVISLGDRKTGELELDAPGRGTEQLNHYKELVNKLNELVTNLEVAINQPVPEPVESETETESIEDAEVS